MKVLIVMFLLTVIAHGVTSKPDLECWGCSEKEMNGVKPCNDQNKFELRKCEKDKTMCIDIIAIEDEEMEKGCSNEEHLKSVEEINKYHRKLIWKTCNTPKCNIGTYTDYPRE